MEFDYNKHIILLALAGSRSYGTNRPDSDYDYRGIIIPPAAFARGFLHQFDERSNLEGYGEDSKAYDIRKFMALASKANPNILETLYVDDSLLEINTKYGEKLRSHRDMFLSKIAFKSFTGYAKGQLHRMKQHKAWWDKEKAGEVPPKPERADFNLPAKPKYGKEVLNNLITVPLDMIDPAQQEYVRNERKYHAAKQKYDSWKEWKANRNPARYILEDQFGYDSKHAMHLVRLMRMGQEILTEGKVIVTRPDAQELLAIRDGAWTYDQLIDWADQTDAEVKAAADSSTLPEQPDFEAINRLCIELVEEAERDGFPNGDK